MKKITLDGDTFTLEIDYDGVEFLEEEFDMSLSKILSTVDIDRQKNLRTLYRALLINKKPNLSDDEMKRLIKGSIEKDGNDFLTLTRTAMEAITESAYMKQIKVDYEKEQKKTQKNNLKKMNA